ncbi:MAG: phosphate ABC transporter permease PstA [Halobacterium sp.]
MSTITESALVARETTLREYVSTGVMALGAVLFLASWTVLFQWVGEQTPVLGVDLFTVFGALLVVMAAGIAGVGTASRLGYVSATPSSTAGLVVGVLFGGIGFVTGGLVASQTFGADTAGWVAAALALGTATAALAVVPREDVGSTFPPALFLAFVGALVLTGTIDLGWSWSPGSVSATFVGSVMVPVLTITASLVGSWSAAKAQAGFGTQGRESGAFYLIRLSVAGMLGVLALLVGFIVKNGLETALTQARVGLDGHVDLPGRLFGVTLPDWTIPFLDVKVPFVTNVSQSLFVDVPGLAPAILGTLWLVFGAVLFAVPLGVAAAIFLAEYTERRRFRQVVEIATNGLWSTPSIVFGLFGLAFLVPRIGGGKSLLSGQIVLGFMLLPLVVITSYESFKAVPDEYRDASAALGVTQWQTIKSAVLPAAMPGVITGVILGVGRIAGETAPLLLVYGGSPFANRNPNVLSRFQFSTSPPFVTNGALMERGSALPYQLYTSITAGRLPGQGAPFSVQEFGWGTALVLLVVVLGLYAIGIASRIYFRRKLYNE